MRQQQPRQQQQPQPYSAVPPPATYKQFRFQPDTVASAALDGSEADLYGDEFLASLQDFNFSLPPPVWPEAPSANSARCVEKEEPACCHVALAGVTPGPGACQAGHCCRTRGCASLCSCGCGLPACQLPAAPGACCSPSATASSSPGRTSGPPAV
jgi:hypothetical protein